MCSCIPSPARTWCGSPPSPVTSSTRHLPKAEFINQWVNGLEEYTKSLRAVHHGIGERPLRACRRDSRRKWRDMIAGGRARVHPVGDGRYAAQHGFGYFYRDLQSAAGHGQLHAAGHRRLSPARAQQRAGRERSRRHAEFFPAIRKWTIPRFAQSLRRLEDVTLPAKPRASTTTR